MIHACFRVSRKSVLSAKELLPTHPTVSTTLEGIHGRLLKSVGLQMLDILRDVGGAISIDYGRKKHDYLTVVIHFLHNWLGTLTHNSTVIVFRQLHHVNVAMFRSQVDSKTYDEVWRELAKAVLPAGIDEFLLKRLFAATDEGSNVTKAMKTYNKKSTHPLGFFHTTTPL